MSPEAITGVDSNAADGKKGKSQFKVPCTLHIDSFVHCRYLISLVARQTCGQWAAFYSKWSRELRRLRIITTWCKSCRRSSTRSQKSSFPTLPTKLVWMCCSGAWSAHPRSATLLTSCLRTLSSTRRAACLNLRCHQLQRHLRNHRPQTQLRPRLRWLDKPRRRLPLAQSRNRRARCLCSLL